MTSEPEVREQFEPQKLAAELHDRIHEVAALVDYHSRVEIGWAPEEAIPMLAEALQAAYSAGIAARDGDKMMHDLQALSEKELKLETALAGATEREKRLREALRNLVEHFHAYEKGWITGIEENWRYRVGLKSDLAEAERVLAEEERE